MKDEKITYNTEVLKLHRAISALTDEEIVRALLVCRLHYEYGYPTDSIELEVPYKAGRPKVIKPRIDILVRDNRKAPKGPTFLFIETKAPDRFELDQDLIEGQLFDLALLETKNGPVKYLAYHSIDIDRPSFPDKLTIIDFDKYPTYEAWQNAGSVSLDTIRENYGEAAKTTYVNVDAAAPPDPLAKSLDNSTTRAAFFALRKHLHNVLWGGGSMSYNDIFSNLVKLFLTKIYDEETTPPGKPYRFQILFNGDEPESPEKVFTRVNDLYNDCRREYLGSTEQDIKQSVGIDREKIVPSRVAYVVERIQGLSLRENRHQKDGDLLGEFFEGIVSDGFKQDRGQFFTHTNIVRFMLDGLDVRQFAETLVRGGENPAKPRLPYICDPSCGSGTFLIDAMKDVSAQLELVRNAGGLSFKTKEFLASNFPDFTPNVWAKEFVYGIEPHGDLAMATKVNMVLHGDGNINVFRRSGLLPFDAYKLVNKASMLAQRSTVKLAEMSGVFPGVKAYAVNEQFDVIITNPPFSVDLDQDTKKSLPGNFLFSQKANSETLFIERWFQLLREGGRVAAVLPDSVFDNKDDLDARLFLYRFFWIKAVVSLPMLAFVPYTPTKTSILFAQKKTWAEIKAFDALWNSEYKAARGYLHSLMDWEPTGEMSADVANAVRYCLYGQVPQIELESQSVNELAGTYSAQLRESQDHPLWLVFRHIAHKLDAPPFAIAHAEQIGYKRSKKTGESPRQNQLFNDPRGLPTEPIAEDYDRIIDYLRATVKW